MTRLHQLRPLHGSSSGASSTHAMGGSGGQPLNVSPDGPGRHVPGSSAGTPAEQTYSSTRCSSDYASQSLSAGASASAEMGSQSGGTATNLNGFDACPVHGAPLLLQCATCDMAQLCMNCLQMHFGHRLQPHVHVSADMCMGALTSECRVTLRQLEESARHLERMAERVESRAHSIANEVRSQVHNCICALEDRKRQLLHQLDTVREHKLSALETQRSLTAERSDTLRNALKQQAGITGAARCAMLAGTLTRTAVDILPEIPGGLPARVQPVEDDDFHLVPTDPKVLAALRSLCTINTQASAQRSSFLGERCRRVVTGRPVVFMIQLLNHVGAPLGAPVDAVAEAFDAFLLTPGAPAVVPIQPAQTALDHTGNPVDGAQLSLTVTPSIDGEFWLLARIRGVPISNSPVKVIARTGRDYGSIGASLHLSFGGEGSGPGQLCRPWGVCVDLRGRIIVADRINNRLQIFDADGNFVRAFGQAGSQPGAFFNRPAGVTVNSKNRIVVADKDNHRIQMFDENGNHLLHFGEKGRAVAQFNYPWDVACNKLDQIAVSDTRNHRVQLFSEWGEFIRKFGFEVSIFHKHLDSPRGLCFINDTQLLLTDFNNHKLVVVTLSGSGAPASNSDLRYVGREGGELGMFRRPQGVHIDDTGHVLVADSKNNRIQVFTAELVPLACFGLDATAGNNLLGGGSPPAAGATLMDRPCDLAVGPNGRIYVVDLGHNCVRVF